MRILLLGSNGQVGFELQRALMPLGGLLPMTRAQIDLTNLKALRLRLLSLKPDVIVNAAAYTAVDKAETEQGAAFLCNAKAVEVLAETAKTMDSLLIHYSTDYVFDGAKTTAYTEQDTPNPINNYGLSKLAGEQGVIAAGGDYLILRTSWVYAARGQNFLRTVLRLACEREQLTIVDDQIGAPTWARLIAETTAHIIKHAQIQRQLGGFNPGVYHLTSAGHTSWFGFAQTVIELARESERYDLKCREINPIPSSAYPLPASRPLNSRLDCSHLQQDFGLKMPRWDNALKLCMAEFL